MMIESEEVCCCEEPGYFSSGLPGVLAHVENGRIISEVERCDACQRYAADADAKQALEAWLKTRTPG